MVLSHFVQTTWRQDRGQSSVLTDCLFLMLTRCVCLKGLRALLCYHAWSAFTLWDDLNCPEKASPGWQLQYLGLCVLNKCLFCCTIARCITELTELYFQDRIITEWKLRYCIFEMSGMIAKCWPFDFLTNQIMGSSPYFCYTVSFAGVPVYFHVSSFSYTKP